MGRHCGKQIRSGIGQLTIVEHAMCPLDARNSIAANLVHDATFRYSDRNHRRRTGNARVFCPLGLSPKDEFYLWGLLGLTLADPNTDGELHLTRHYCLRKLGLIDAKQRRGGRQFRDFSSAVERLAAVRYQCDRFYDPIRAEHRKVSFGFFSYSIPLHDEPSRAWRFVWDPIFFEFVRAAGGSLRFNLNVYRELDTASRRMYLMLSKLFYRRTVTQRLDVKDFAEQILGVAPTVSLRDKKSKLKRCMKSLEEQRVIRDGVITRLGKGRYAMVLHRGSRFDEPKFDTTYESPLVEPLVDLGFDLHGANRLLRRYDQRLIREWVDITLTARSRFGSKFFSKSAPAFLTDNLKHAANGTRTPPDWWGKLFKEELNAAAERAKKCRNVTQKSDQSIKNSIETLSGVHDSIFCHFVAAGQTEEVARQNAMRYQHEHLRRTTDK